MNKSADITIIGGGIIGSCIARKLSQVAKNKKILLLEKESHLGQHASTRNSSVIHAGIYYSSDSFKSKFCKKGNEMLTQYIEDNNLPLKKTGKYIVATNENEYQRLIEVKNQAIKNTIDVEWIPIQQAVQIEPTLKLINKDFHVLYAPSTKVGDNQSVINQLEKDLKQQNNVELLYNSKFLNFKQQDTNQDTNIINCQNKIQNINFQIETKYLINCAGLYADKIAQQFGFCQDYEILPLKGSYVETKQKIQGLKSLIYPVPPVQGSTVLGVHLTHTMNDTIKLGPNALPALWREQYDDFWKLKNFDALELFQIIQTNLRNIIQSENRNFYLGQAMNELKKYNVKVLIEEIQKMTTVFEKNNCVQASDFHSNTRAGIRSQLIDKKTRKPINDFIIEQNENSLHLLNVVSPGWTCAFPMAEHIVENMKLNKII